MTQAAHSTKRHELPFFERAGTVLWTRERTQNRLLSMPAGGIVATDKGRISVHVPIYDLLNLLNPFLRRLP